MDSCEFVVGGEDRPEESVDSFGTGAGFRGSVKSFPLSDFVLTAIMFVETARPLCAGLDKRAERSDDAIP
jgi:hypothetical protein